MMRKVFLCASIFLVGCAAPRRVVNDTQGINAGVDIIPRAMLAAEKIVPSTQPVPAQDPDLIDILSRSEQKHYYIIEILRKSGLVGMLQEQGPFTLLAPTDDAFDKFPKDVLERVLLPEHHAELVNFVKLHLLRGRVTFNDMLQTKGQVPTMSGQIILINGLDGKVMVNDANVIRTDTAATNGIIHWLDNVLIPQ